MRQSTFEPEEYGSLQYLPQLSHPDKSLGDTSTNTAFVESETTDGTSQDKPREGRDDHEASQGHLLGASSLDLSTASLGFSQPDISTILNSMTPSADFDFPADLWFHEMSPLAWNVLATESSPGTGRPKVTPATIYGTSPYASCPLFHDLTESKSSAVKLMDPICGFLQDRSSWRQVEDASAKQSKNDIRSSPKISHQTRDALVAITHLTISKALESNSMRGIPLTFPPLETIQCLFRACLTRYARHYPFIHPRTFEETADKGREGLTFPIFLQNVMVLGALLLPVKEGQAFANEMGYHIRQIMHETMTQDIMTTDDIWMLSSTILITAAGAWSGNKVHVELAEAHRGLYTVVSYSIFYNCRLEPKWFFRCLTGVVISSLEVIPKTVMMLENHGSTGSDEKEEEGRSFQDDLTLELNNNRVCHVWYIVEQELSFFDCITSHISFTEMRGPMPCPDSEFYCETEEEWLVAKSARLRMDAETKPIRAPSLASLYWLFTRDDFLHMNVVITPLQLRLLQCALQTQVLQNSQTARFINVEEAFPEIPLNTSTNSQLSTCAQIRLEEIQGLLVRWFILSKRVMGSKDSSEMSLACYLMHHLISMELHICFEDVQCLAGKDGLEVGRTLVPQFCRWAKSPASMRAIAHAGQVVSLLQSSVLGENSNQVRPLWWPVALTRATLVMWSYSISCRITARHEPSTYENLSLLIPLNDKNEDSGPYGKVIQFGEGQPCLINDGGKLVPLSIVHDMIDVSLKILEDVKSESTPLCESILRFIQEIQRCGVPY